MEFVWAALIMGFAGSLHCLGMCGPLVMAVHSAKSNGNWWVKKFVYHLGRISVYALLGAISGSIGHAFIAFGFQRWVAFTAGAFMLLFLAWPAGMKRFRHSPLALIGWLKSKFSLLLTKKNLGTHFALGVINGLLPCGLVYVAVAASLAVSDPLKSAAFMALFGLGTTPALFAAGSILGWFGKRLRAKSFRMVQISLAAIALLLVIRGANLGIPYLSPKYTAESKQMDCCHKPQ